MTKGDFRRPGDTYLEVQPERFLFSLYRAPVVLCIWSVWTSRNLDGFPINRFQHLSAANARSKSEWARLNPYLIVMIFGTRWQRCFRRIWEMQNV